MSMMFGIRLGLLRAVLISGVAVALGIATPTEVAAGPGTESPTYRITGNYVEICTCPKVCESALLGTGRAACAFVAGLRIDAGQRGAVPLGGLAAALVAAAPGEKSAQPGKAVAALYIDVRASPAQAEALAAIACDRFSERIFGPIAAPKPAAIAIERSTDVISIAIDGIVDARGRPLLGGYHRLVQLQNGPGMTFPVLFLARGAVGQVADPSVGVRFEAEGKSILYGKFDIANPRVAKKK